MKALYSIGIRCYAFVIRIASFFNPKAKDWVNGRKNFWQSLPNIKEKEVYWFHCASLGEFDQGLPVMNLLRKENPSAFILVTFFSPSGMNFYQKRKHPVDYACYLPIDTQQNAKRFITHFKPKHAFFVKYEFWANYIFELKKNKSKIYSISTLLRPNHRFFKWYGGYFRKILNQFDYFFVQNQSTFDLLKSINIHNAMITGDTRYDRVIENKNNLVKNEILSAFIGTSKAVFIAGSTWPKDEEVLKPIFEENLFERYIIAPHNVDEIHVQSLIKTINKPVIRYSKITPDELTAGSILVIDTIGLLASAYSYGSISYIGGGYSKSLHNILEPAVFGLPVIFGPIYNRFPEAQAFIDNGIGFSIKDTSELKTVIKHVISQKEEISHKSSLFIEENKGAAQKILSAILSR
ncbi:MAG: 3-deoxy-D-manno-octulosonic acid transferase [Crocinitomicaceae bacterium]|nr:3-deoxy-D-manno-octulosonic acid transferase [Crocinitomicaceae bacterium]